MYQHYIMQLSEVNTECTCCLSQISIGNPCPKMEQIQHWKYNLAYNIHIVTRPSSINILTHTIKFWHYEVFINVIKVYIKYVWLTCHTTLWNVSCNQHVQVSSMFGSLATKCVFTKFQKFMGVDYTINMFTCVLVFLVLVLVEVWGL